MNREIEKGCQYPYHGEKPKDDAERIALGILWDLGDRRGIKHELQQVDIDVRGDIVRDLAKIIREGLQET